MTKQLRLVAAAALTLALHAGAMAQTTLLPVTAAQEVQRLAPQLVAFAGSDANFQNLVNGLSQGVPVILTTVTADGFLQTVTFTPASALSSADIARTLETARQQLIARGVANPTAEQIGVTMAGGNLPTPAGITPVGGLLTTLTPGGIRAGASFGGSRPPSPVLGTVNTGSNLVVDIRPTLPPQATSASPATSTSASPGTTTSASSGTSTSASPLSSSPVVRFTSDSTRTGNTSDTPVLSNTPSGASAAQPPAATFNSSTGVSNGAPSPAAQMQGRR